MSRRQLARTPDNFPYMKHRAAGRLARRPRGGIASFGGGYRCSEHGIAWNWGRIGSAEYAEIHEAIVDHEATHDFEYDNEYAPGDSPFDRWEAVGRAFPTPHDDVDPKMIAGFTIREDMTLSPGEAFVERDGKQVGWIKLDGDA